MISIQNFSTLDEFASAVLKALFASEKVEVEIELLNKLQFHSLYKKMLDLCDANVHSKENFNRSFHHRVIPTFIHKPEKPKTLIYIYNNDGTKIGCEVTDPTNVDKKINELMIQFKTNDKSRFHTVFSLNS